jgi:hypothetical protein
MSMQTRYAVKYMGSYLTFGSYSSAVRHDDPQPRGMFKRKADAVRRAKEEHYTATETLSPSDMQVVKISCSYLEV